MKISNICTSDVHCVSNCVTSLQAWIIGIVEKGSRTARIIDKPRVIEVPAKEKEGELW